MIARARLPLALSTALWLVSTEIAQAQTTCLTEADVTAMAGFALPTLIDGVVKTCKPSLAPAGYFARQGPALVSRYADQKALAWPGAKAAFFKLGNDDDPDTVRVLAKMPDTALQPLVEGLVAQLAAKKLDAQTCATIERGSELLALLPPENTARLIGLIVALSGDKRTKPATATTRKMNFTICPATSKP